MKHRSILALALTVGTALVAPTVRAQVDASSEELQTNLPIAGLIGNETSFRAVYPISPYEAEGAEYLPNSRVLQLADGRVHFVPPGSPWDAYGPADHPAAMAAAKADRDWLAAGVVPGDTPEQQEMAARALLDMRTMTRPNGAAVVSWYDYWQFVWPRDASWISAAFAATGHPSEAVAVLRFLQNAQHEDGTWDARYHPIDATPVKDGRQWQLDGNGWVPWATNFWWATVPHTSATKRQLTELWPMVQSAAEYAAKSLDQEGLPPASPDYWEINTDKPNLGTAAPLLSGLRGAAVLADEMGRQDLVSRWTRAADRLQGAIDTHFAPNYTRTIDPDSGLDTAVTFLAPPFAPYDPDVDAAIERAEETLTIDNGGVIPGEAWPGNPTESWTAESGWFGLAAAGADRQDDATRWLDWIADHRTGLGAIPEKVDGDGDPASVAPFAWTDAVVLLTMVAQDGDLPPAPAENLALGKTATQVSTGYGGTPDRAVDGSTDGVFSHGSVTHTNTSPQPWWQVDLGSDQAIGDVTLWNRTDCCSDRLQDFYVLVSDEPFTSDSLDEALQQPGVWASHQADPVGVRRSIPVDTEGRYVRIQLASQSSTLHLAEVQVHPAD
jgi:glucoamylase